MMRYLIRTSLDFEALRQKLQELDIEAEEVSPPMENGTNLLMDVDLSSLTDASSEDLLSIVLSIDDIEEALPSPDAEPF